MVDTDHTRTIFDFDDLVSRRAHQLHALLGHLSGEAGPCFRALPEPMREAYHQTCYGLAQEIVDALAEIGRLRLAARDMAH